MHATCGMVIQRGAAEPISKREQRCMETLFDLWITVYVQQGEITLRLKNNSKTILEIGRASCRERV